MSRKTIKWLTECIQLDTRNTEDLCVRFLQSILFACVSIQRMAVGKNVTPSDIKENEFSIYLYDIHFVGKPITELWDFHVVLRAEFEVDD